jgi:hypothetical protein
LLLKSGASIGMLGSAREQYRLRQSCVFLNMHPLNLNDKIKYEELESNREYEALKKSEEWIVPEDLEQVKNNMQSG